MTQFIDRRKLLKIASATLLGWNFAKAADWNPSFFNPHEDKTLMALTELIIPRTDTPGAYDANVHRYLGLFLSVAAPIDQKQFVDGLSWLDRMSQQHYKRDFADCTQDEQTGLLRPLANANLFFNQAMTMTSLIYLSTPEGYKELNKLGPPPATLACQH
jgi:hypothetical protein